MSTKKKVSVWTIDKSRYTDEELRKIKLRAETRTRGRIYHNGIKPRLWPLYPSRNPTGGMVERRFIGV